jgi:hypothetical protein
LPDCGQATPVQIEKGAVYFLIINCHLFVYLFLKSWIDALAGSVVNVVGINWEALFVPSFRIVNTRLYDKVGKRLRY